MAGEHITEQVAPPAQPSAAPSRPGPVDSVGTGHGLSIERLTSRLPSAGAMYGAAWVVVIYTALRYLALTRHHHIYGDSYGYHAAARLPFFSVDFWAGLRSFTIPLFWKLLGNNEGLTVGVQFVISSSAGSRWPGRWRGSRTSAWCGGSPTSWCWA